ncbi:toluene efflux pump membrane transporter TtgE [Antarctobacter heliothermus]|uniref:Toluene efflux pump membrane transporter TtgE n=1 Tax=Antarctobacter heliothermus TaxID=74033 RepID=A0A222E815_9RHOB|nr:efflux RND transporter permease subunit [Antarctobacter heliothermus]ASP22337.1 toluene efflux pump membrane transporter TtgE [Antarctobacter heliothermus]
MTGIIDWAAERARMIVAFIILGLVAGTYAYLSLPKEGEPDIEIPALFVSVPFPGISATDAEKLLVKPMETELSDLDGLKAMTATAAEGYAGLALEFEFGWDKTKIIADVRDGMNNAEGNFPVGAEKYSINEINFSEFPILIVNLSGPVPERTLTQVAKDLQDRVEGLDSVLEAGVAGSRDEMLEVVIDPLRLESYNVTADELIRVVQNNNQLIAAGEVETDNGTFSVKIPSSFDEPRDVYDLPVKVNGDRVVTLGELATINLTFEDRKGTARFNGDQTVALQVVKRKGFNIIDTVTQVQEVIDTAQENWPPELRAVLDVGTSNDQSRQVASMVGQLEGSVLTAIALVMIVVLASLGLRPALLVGFAIPTSFMLCFVLLALMGVTISNIVMFGLILAVGMLVDSAVVVVEYADKRISEGTGPMHAYVEAAHRMFWPVVSSTATTLCAFLPMLFWPGVAGEFMGMLPVTLIFVLLASLVVALIYLPVMGGVSGRFSRNVHRAGNWLRARLHWSLRILLVPLALLGLFVGAMMVLNPSYLVQTDATGWGARVPGVLVFVLFAVIASVVMDAAELRRPPRRIEGRNRRSLFGHFTKFIAGNPIMPLVTVAAVMFLVVNVFTYYGENNNGVDFFVESEPEQAIVYVRARGNLGLAEKDALVRRAEEIVLNHPGILNAFSFAGEGGLDNNTGGAAAPKDTIGQVQFETIPWEGRPAYARETGVPLAQLDGDVILDDLTRKLESIPGIEIEILAQARGPASAKPVHLRIKGDDWDALLGAAGTVRAKFGETPGLTLIEDTRPLPGIDWEIDVDVEKAGRYGADVATVGAMVQLVTRGVLLDSYTPDGSDEEIEIRVRLPESDRVLSTLDSLKVRTADGLVPLSNFITREPVAKLAEIERIDQKRYFDVKAGVREKLMEIGWDVTSTAPDGTETTTFEPLLTGIEMDPETQDVSTAEWERDFGRSSGFYEWLLGPNHRYFDDVRWLTDLSPAEIDAALKEEGHAPLKAVPVTGPERIEVLTAWLDTNPLPSGIEWEWTGDQEDQEESQAFLQSAFGGALFLMFIILLAQFNSFYNAVLVLLAVVMSTTGVLIGMLVMDQYFSVIMTGTGIVALAGIVVNNNIVLIDTYQDYSRYMPRIEAIVRTAQDRLRPVLLTTITTMAGLTPMMLGLSLDFFGGGYSIDSPTALWWKNLATAVVFGLGIATVLTLVFTPAMLAIRVWFTTYVEWFARLLARLSYGRGSRAARDWALNRAAKRVQSPEILWEEDPSGPMDVSPDLRAAE